MVFRLSLDVSPASSFNRIFSAVSRCSLASEQKSNTNETSSIKFISSETSSLEGSIFILSFSDSFDADLTGSPLPFITFKISSLLISILLFFME
ncbi:MAG: hypothetical protein ACD_79C01011G0001 [uncultured bacterium]|nr:MAG: hypothetical protein ACD_79C01011G0001 [uncultured bacterium]